MSAHPSATDDPARRRASHGRDRSAAVRDWLVASLLVALSVVPVVAGGARLISLARGVPTSPDSERFFAVPAPVVLHILCASLFCVVGAFQFGGEFRRRWPRWHRASGRLLVPAGLMAALTGLWMTQFYPPGVADGEALYAARLLVGTAMTACVVLGFVTARRGDFAQHRSWMTRAYALGMGAGTQVLTQLPWFLLVGPTNELARSVLMITAWAINMVVAEWVIRRPVVGARRATSSAFIPKITGVRGLARERTH